MSVKPQHRRSDAEDSRTRILEAARARFGERGSSEVTMAEVAQAAGVSRATVFNHFGSKHGLIEAVTETVFAGYEAILDRALADRETPVPVLVRALFEIMGRGIEGDPAFYRTAFREIARVTLGLEEGGGPQRARQRAVERLEHLLTRGQARGELEVGQGAEDLATAFDSLVFGTITHWLYADASRGLVDRMRAASEIFLSPVATASTHTWRGALPELWIDGDPGFGRAAEGGES